VQPSDSSGDMLLVEYSLFTLGVSSFRLVSLQQLGGDSIDGEQSGNRNGKSRKKLVLG